MSRVLDQLAHVCDLSRTEHANLTADSAAGATTLALDSTQGLAANDYVVIGGIGRNNTEIALVKTVDSVTQITLNSALSYAHKERDPVYETPYNQVKFYVSTTEGGTYTEVATVSPAAMEVDQYYTVVVDATGSASKWYKFSWYNSTSAAESDKSEAFLGGRPDQICTLEEVKRDLDIPLEKTENDAKIQDAIEWVSSEIINFTNVQFVSKTVTDEYQDIDDDQDVVFPKYFPVYSEPTVVDDGTTLDYDEDPDLTDFNWYPGFIKSAIGNFTPGRRRVKLSYVAYREPPSEVKQVAVQMAGIRAGLKTRTFVDAENITQAVALRSVPDELWDILKRHKRKDLF